MNERRADRVASARRSLAAASPQERAVAAVELAELEAVGELAGLERLVEDPAPVAAVAAIYACYRLGAAPPIERAVAAAASADEEARQAAVHAFGELGEVAVGPLVAELERGGPHRREILHLLSEIGGPSAHAAVSAVADSKGGDAAIADRLLKEWED